MDARIAELARLLRSGGVRVSPAEVADAVRAAALAGVDERATLRAALRATLVKRARDVPVFEALFAVWTSALGRAVAGAERGVLADLREAGLAGDDLDTVARALAELAGGMTPLARAALGGDVGVLARLLAEAAARIDLGGLASPAASGFLSRRLLGAAGGQAAEDDAARLAGALRARGLAEGPLRVVGEAVRAALRRADEAARRLAEKRRLAS